jgi:hypothetical protein
MHLLRGGYLDIYALKEVPKDKFDVVFVGRDKGRGDDLLVFEKELNDLGLKTYFHICGDRRFINSHKKYYRPVLAYEDYLKLAGSSKSILNIMPEGQTSLTMRDYEAAFNGIKEITNNKDIVRYDIYDKSRFFILGKDDLAGLKDFLNTPFEPVPEDILRKYRYNTYLEQLLQVVRDAK